ncbi:MAG: 4Fe-4S dicluster domain-containing protein [Nitrososphaerota archaeon]|jgi:NAD-dependent dihydropyrimidine dehydrogenase PreA subunit|nr:4Fe-4S dicluster domain-containing protein [Nitrososphaerota archaeon]
MARILIRVNEEQVAEPIAAQIIIEYKVPMVILSAHINNKGGEILVEFPDDMETKIADAFRRRGVTVTIPKLIQVNTEKCFSCGTCIALCPVEAINIDKNDTVQFNKEKCLGNTCNICVDACPARAIKSLKTNNNDRDQNRKKKT